MEQFRLRPSISSKSKSSSNHFHLMKRIRMLTTKLWRSEADKNQDRVKVLKWNKEMNKERHTLKQFLKVYFNQTNKSLKLFKGHQLASLWLIRPTLLNKRHQPNSISQLMLGRQVQEDIKVTMALIIIKMITDLINYNSLCSARTEYHLVKSVKTTYKERNQALIIPDKL